MKRSGIACVLAAVALGVGCGSATVSKGQVEEQAKKALATVVGREPEDITCPSNLDAKVGATIRCVLSDGGKQWGVTVTVTQVDGSDVKFNTVVDENAIGEQPPRQ